MKGTSIRSQGSMSRTEKFVLKFAFWYLLFQILRGLAEGRM